MNDETKLLKAEIKRLRKLLEELTLPLETILKRRGFTIYKKEPSEDLLLPEGRYLRVFYERLKRYSFRLFLRDIIKYQNYFTIDKVTKFATKEVSSQYLKFLLKTGVVESFRKGYRLKKRPIKSFGETLEWYIARLIKKDFQAETTWGVKFKRPNVGGDYDLIAKIDSSILYMEVKSSPPKQIYDKEITAFLNRVEDLAPEISIFLAFLNRVEDLAPEISIFLVDTELRMKDKIVPMFETELHRRYMKPVPVERIIKELFHISKKIFIINSKDSISSNIGTVLRYKLNKALRLMETGGNNDFEK
jgi:hypothetical protein